MENMKAPENLRGKGAAIKTNRHSNQSKGMYATETEDDLRQALQLRDMSNKLSSSSKDHHSLPEETLVSS